MTEKRFTCEIDESDGHLVDVWYDNGRPIYSANEIVGLLNALHEENEQLKQDKFICLDCEHSGYTEIGCLCEKKDHWTDYKTECEDYEELK